jgi:hypothetical protein
MSNVTLCYCPGGNFHFHLQFYLIQYKQGSRESDWDKRVTLNAKSGVHHLNLMACQNFFVVLFKGQNFHVFTFLNGVFIGNKQAK